MTVKDPVCGAEVSAASAAAVEAHGPLALHFCSDECHQLYLADPNRYVSHDPGGLQRTDTTEDVHVMPQPWRDDGDLDGPPVP